MGRKSTKLLHAGFADALRYWSKSGGLKRWAWRNSANLFALAVAIGATLPVFVGWDDVVRETRGTLIFCRYVHATPVWLISLLMVLVVLAGAWCVFCTFSEFRWVPFLMVILLAVSFFGLKWTMEDEAFKFHAMTVAGVVFAQVGLILLMAPSRWPVVAFGIIPIAAAGVFGTIRNYETTALVESIYSLSSWLTALMVPLAFLGLDWDERPLNYYTVTNHSAPVLIFALLMIATVQVMLFGRGEYGEDRVPGSQHEVRR